MIVIILVHDLPDLISLIKAKLDPDSVETDHPDSQPLKLAIELLLLISQIDAIDLLCHPEAYDVPIDLHELIGDESIFEMSHQIANTHLVSPSSHLKSIKPINQKGDLLLWF